MSKLSSWPTTGWRACMVIFKKKKISCIFGQESIRFFCWEHRARVKKKLTNRFWPGQLGRLKKKYICLCGIWRDSVVSTLQSWMDSRTPYRLVQNLNLRLSLQVSRQVLYHQDTPPHKGNDTRMKIFWCKPDYIDFFNFKFLLQVLLSFSLLRSWMFLITKYQQ